MTARHRRPTRNIGQLRSRWTVPMRTFARFAAIFLSAATLQAATLVEVKEPASIDHAFSASATLRIMNVWATWYGPCVEEIGDFAAIAKQFGARVSVVGVSLDDMIPGDR